MKLNTSQQVVVASPTNARWIGRIWWGSLLIILMIGIVSLVKGYFLEGMTSTNLSNIVPWGLWVAFYIYFIGMSAGSFLLSTLIYGFGMHKF